MIGGVPLVFRMLTDASILSNMAGEMHTVTLLTVVLLCLLALSKGADWMIDGVVMLAYKTGLPRMLIGATIISLGTTLPEMVVSVIAALMGDASLALGNAVGSIIGNTGLIFGVTCILTPVPMNRRLLNRTGWAQDGSAALLVAASIFAFFQMPAQPILDRWIGFFFLLLLGVYLAASYAAASRRRGSPCGAENRPKDQTASLPRVWGLITAGVFIVVLSARLLVPCVAELAKRMGVSEDVIAATMVALGTSIPEFITAIRSVGKGYPEITLGNIIGANVLNTLFVIGAAVAVHPLPVSRSFYWLHYPSLVLVLASFRLFVVQNKTGRFDRWNGWWLVGLYVLYLSVQYGLPVDSAPP